MKISLSTDYGSPHHWRRLVEFAATHGVERLVYWGDSSTLRFGPPYLYEKYGDLLGPELRAKVQIIRANMGYAAALARDAGIDFWFCYQVLVPPPLDALRALHPDWFTPRGEPDLSREEWYTLLRDQLNELRATAPTLAGVEMWIMEAAKVVVDNLKDQRIGLEEICVRIVDTVHDECRRLGLSLGLDLHVAAGNPLMDRALLAAGRRHPDILFSADNVIGDFHLHWPFNPRLREAARTNPVAVHFDLNGEYWGRNMVPTCALDQYARHIEEARKLGVVYLDGRCATAHDSWSPYVNVLPSRRAFYPALAEIEPGKPLPRNIEVCCVDTLGGFNARFFCARARDAGADSAQTLRDFLRAEFGPSAEALAPILIDVERLALSLYYADKHCFIVHTVLMEPALVPKLLLAEHLLAPAGERFPPEAAGDMAWLLPPGHRAAGAMAMIEEKRAAVAYAGDLLARADLATAVLAPDDRRFILSQFEDLEFLARFAAALLEAQAHFYHLVHGKRQGPIPDAARLTELLASMRRLAMEWEGRYADGRYHLAHWLRVWAEKIELEAVKG
ncbi:MAG: hypothetical protein NTW19_11205 [Planctomycetota bacterium]|nr:hypothetical protein [Planctomycetota bacterium]